jgi:hypothetical protein
MLYYASPLDFLSLIGHEKKERPATVFSKQDVAGRCVIL